MHVLIVEDDRRKAQQIEAHVLSVFSDIEVSIAESVRSGVDAVEAAIPDLLLLDMTLPMFDKSSGEAGWKTRMFGGKQILRELFRRGILPSVYVISGYEAFKSGTKIESLEAITTALRDEYGECLLGATFYDTASDEWRTKLSSAIKRVRLKLDRERGSQ